MNKATFCDSLGTELAAWKNNVLGIADKLESQSGAVKSSIRGHIEDIRILAQELEDRVSQLSETCSINGFDDILLERQKDLAAQVNVRDADSAVGMISGGNFGG